MAKTIDRGRRDTTRVAARQPRCSATLASIGRNTSCPVALAADSAPSTSPRRASNQRVATTAASTIDVTPVPGADAARPRAASAAIGFCICVRERDGARRAARRAARTTRRRPHRSITDAANGPMSPNSAMLMATAAGDDRPVPAELRLERHHQHARRRANAGRDEQDDERDRRDDPGIVETRPGARCWLAS